MSVQFTIQDLRAYLAENLLSSYESFISYYNGNEIEQGRDRRNAEACAESMLHLGDRFFLLRGGATGSGFSNATELRRALFQECRAYALVSDVALVAKHAAITRGEGLVRTADALSDHVAIDRYEDGHGPYFRYRKLLEAQLPGEGACDFGRVLFYVAKFLFDEAVRESAIPKPPKLTEPLQIFVRRDSPDRERKFVMIGNVGDRVRNGHRIFFYRPASKMLTPPGRGERLGATPGVQYEARVGPSCFGE
jgi:hypothetical protein